MIHPSYIKHMMKIEYYTSSGEVTAKLVFWWGKDESKNIRFYSIESRNV